MRKNFFSMAVFVIMIASMTLKPTQAIKSRPKTTKAEIKANESHRKASVEPLPSYQTDIVPYQPTEQEIKDEKYWDSLETLAICVEAEAGNQGLMGKRLVVDVILNRVDSPRFPNDIESVIYQRNQFSTSFDGGMDRVIEPSEETFMAVRMELAHRTDKKILFFTAGGFNPYCIPAYRFGAHYFGY